MNFSSMGPFLQEQTAPALVPHEVTSTASKPAPAWATLSTGPQVLAGACSSMGSPQGHSLLWAHPPAQHRVPSTGYRWISAPPWTSIGCRGTACLTMVFSTGCRGISVLAPGAPPSPPSLALVSAGLFLSYSLTPLSYCSFLFPLLNYVIPEALPPSLVGSALASSGSVLEPAGIGSIGHRGSFSQLLKVATAVAPPATKALPHKPNTVSLI